MLFSFENQHLFLFNTINSQFTFKKSPAKLLEFSCGTLALVIHSFCLVRLLWICVLRLNKVNEATQINCVAVPKYCLTRPTYVHKLPTCLYCYCLYLVISHSNQHVNVRTIWEGWGGQRHAYSLCSCIHVDNYARPLRVSSTCDMN